MLSFLKLSPPHHQQNVVTVSGDVKVVIVLTNRSDVTVSMIVLTAAMSMIVVRFHWPYLDNHSKLVLCLFLCYMVSLLLMCFLLIYIY